jgi:hypothetical protein
MVVICRGPQVQGENSMLKEAADERDAALEQLKALKDALREMAEQKDSDVASARKEVITLGLEIALS